LDKVPIRSAIAFIGVVALSGCMVGPDFQRPPPPQADRYTETPMAEATVAAAGTGGASQRLLPGTDLPAQWWALYRSEPLDALIKDALAESPTLASAQAALRVAQENLAVGRGDLLYPAIDGRASATRQQISGSTLGAPGLGTSLFTLYNASVNVSYAFDVFGGARREIEALESLVDYQGYQLEGAHLTLTSNVVTTAIREAALRAQVRSTQEIIAALEKQLTVVERQFKLGAVSKPDVLAQRTQLAQTQATLPLLERNLAQTRHQLAVLAGRLPSAGGLPQFELDALTLPPEIPLSVPSSLVRQRPDILASEALLHQASAEIGVATADLYPKINLTGSFGGQALKLADLFAGPSVWSIGAGLLQPIFRGDALNAKRRAAIAAYDEAAAQYRQTVLLAFQNVADTLRALDDDARTLVAQAAAEAYAREALALAERQFRLGATSYLTLLNAQRQYHLARLALVQAQAARYADTAALFQALGGGWWQRTAASGPPPISRVN
jgi:NodT family efflux transporter outer membrane factor (OMF) lipoprotein